MKLLIFMMALMFAFGACDRSKGKGSDIEWQQRQEQEKEEAEVEESGRFRDVGPR